MRESHLIPEFPPAPSCATAPDTAHSAQASIRGSLARAAGMGIPSLALKADYRATWRPTRRPTSNVNPFLGGSEHALLPVRLPPSGSPQPSMPRRVRVLRQKQDGLSQADTFLNGLSRDRRRAT